MLEKKLTAGVLVQGSEKHIDKDVLINKIVSFVNVYELDIFLGPEWLFLPKKSEKRLYSESEKDEILGEIAEKTKDTESLIIPGSIMWEDKKFYYNAAPLISEGMIIGEAYKDGDGGTSGIARKSGKKQFRPWTPKTEEDLLDRTKDGIFKWREYDVGVEICCDHGHIRKLKVYDLDLYFLVSCGQDIMKGSLPIRQGGYALCSEGSRKVSQVYQRKNVKKFEHKYIEPENKTKEVKPKFFSFARALATIGKHPADNNGLNLYELVLNTKTI